MTATPVDRFLRLSPQQRAEFVRRAGWRPASGPPDAGGRSAERPAAAPGQESLWLLWRMAPDSPDYNVPHCYDIHGPVRPDALRAALDAVIARHDSLRTTFAEDERDELRLVVHDRLVDTLRVADATDRADAMIRAEALAARPFDLRTGPLIRARLWRYAPDRHMLAIVCHHIVIDERSSRILEDELAEHYRAICAGEAAAVPALPLRYGDAVAAQRSRDTTAALDYWRGQLDGAGGGTLPADFAAPPVRRRDGATIERELSAGALRALSRGRATTPFVATAAAFAVFVARHTGQTDVTFGAALSGREVPGSEALIGHFVNLAVLRLRLDPAASFDDLARQAHRVVADATRHAGVGLQDVVRAVRPGVPSDRTGLFDLSFVHLAAEQATGPFAGPAGWAGGITVHPVHLAAPGASFDLTAAVVETPDRALLALRYAGELYRPATVRRWADDFAEVLTRLADQPASSIAGLLSTADAGRGADIPRR